MGKQRFPVMQVIKNLDGTDAKNIVRSEKKCEACGQRLTKSQPFILRDAFVQCLVSEKLDQRGQPILAPGPIRYERGRLALRISDANDMIWLSEEEIIDIRELAAQFLPLVAQMRVWNILDAPEKEEKSE